MDMSKKDIREALTLQQPDHASPKKGRPVTQTKVITKRSQDGTMDNETRATFIVNEGLLEKLKDITYLDILLIKNLVSIAVQHKVDKYEQENVVINPISTK